MRPPERAVLREFWLSIRRGAATEEAAAGLGYTKRTGTRWFGQAGGVVPAYVTAQRGRRNLAFDEREEIFAGVERGDSIRLIARSLGRAPSTVQRGASIATYLSMRRARVSTVLAVAIRYSIA